MLGVSEKREFDCAVYTAEQLEELLLFVLLEELQLRHPGHFEHST
jgi:hypothetical protein